VEGERGDEMRGERREMRVGFIDSLAFSARLLFPGFGHCTRGLGGGSLVPPHHTGSG
jgi:hypothetical protein